MSPKKLRLLAECLERDFITTEDRKGWITDLRGLAKTLERRMAESTTLVDSIEDPQVGA